MTAGRLSSALLPSLKQHSDRDGSAMHRILALAQLLP